MERLLISVLLGLTVFAANPAPAREDHNMAIAVRIVPTSFNDAGGRVITLSDPSRHFSVVITNVGDKPVMLWREWCGWGYFNLSFEMTDQAGAHVAITKKPIGWEKNYPDWMVVPPGDHMVVDVSFDPGIWRNAPMPAAGKSQTIGLRAIYESADSQEAKANRVWTGKVSSPENTYTIIR
jgi:hypothetical protein